MFTQCGDACQLITAKLVQVKRELGEAFGTEVRFLSLSIDPQHDRPADLAKFAKKFDAVHPEWLFLTGEPANMAAVVKKRAAISSSPRWRSCRRGGLRSTSISGADSIPRVSACSDRARW